LTRSADALLISKLSIISQTLSHRLGMKVYYISYILSRDNKPVQEKK